MHWCVMFRKTFVSLQSQHKFTERWEFEILLRWVQNAMTLKLTEEEEERSSVASGFSKWTINIAHATCDI